MCCRALQCVAERCNTLQGHKQNANTTLNPAPEKRPLAQQNTSKPSSHLHPQPYSCEGSPPGNIGLFCKDRYWQKQGSASEYQFVFADVYICFFCGEIVRFSHNYRALLQRKINISKAGVSKAGVCVSQIECSRDRLNVVKLG